VVRTSIQASERAISPRSASASGGCLMGCEALYHLGRVWRVIQSRSPIRYALFDGMDVRDNRVHYYPPRWNAAPSQEAPRGRLEPGLMLRHCLRNFLSRYTRSDEEK
jgi:hypothetical protein